MIASAVQGGGKSVETVRQIIYQAYISPHKRNGLIFDTNNEFGEIEIQGVKHHIKTLSPNDIIKFNNQEKKEVRRVIPFHASGHPMSPEETEELLIKVCTTARNVNLLIEDLNTIYGDALPVRISGLLCNVRHRMAFVIFHIQSVARLLPKILQNCKIIRYHYQLDAVADSAGKFPGEIDIFSIAEKLVNKQYESGNIRYFIYIYREIKKIKGAFSPKMFYDACKEYVYDNPKTTSSLEKRRDENGKKVYTYEQCVDMKANELFTKYYGNQQSK